MSLKSKFKFGRMPKENLPSMLNDADPRYIRTQLIQYLRVPNRYLVNGIEPVVVMSASYVRKSILGLDDL